MKLIWLVSVLYVLTVSAQLTAPTRNYNVTSPVTNGPYVIGQILPCTYRLFSDVDTSTLSLDISLESSTQGATNATIVPVTGSADVSRTDAFIKREGNITYYEHSINFNIPSTVKPGNYFVIFSDKSTNTKLSIPIEIRPAASTTSTGSKATSTGTFGHPQPSNSVFAQNAAYSIQIDSMLVLFTFVISFFSLL